MTRKRSHRYVAKLKEDEPDDDRSCTNSGNDDTYTVNQHLDYSTFFPRKVIQEALESFAEKQGYDKGFATLKGNLLETVGTMSALWMDQHFLRPLLAAKTADENSNDPASRIITLEDVLNVARSYTNQRNEEEEEEEEKESSDNEAGGDGESKKRAASSVASHDPILSSLLEVPDGALHVLLEQGLSSDDKKPAAKKRRTATSTKTKQPPRSIIGSSNIQKKVLPSGVDAKHMVEHDAPPCFPPKPQKVIQDEEDYD